MAAFIILLAVLLLEVGVMIVAATPRRFFSRGWTRVHFITTAAFVITLYATIIAEVRMIAS